MSYQELYDKAEKLLEKHKLTICELSEIKQNILNLANGKPTVIIQTKVKEFFEKNGYTLTQNEDEICWRIK